jgi:hypothetical protein
MNQSNEARAPHWSKARSSALGSAKPRSASMLTPRSASRLQRSGLGAFSLSSSPFCWTNNNSRPQLVSRSIVPIRGTGIQVSSCGSLRLRSTLAELNRERKMRKNTLGLIAGAAILAAMSIAHAQSTTPIEGTPGSGTGKPTPSPTSSAAPNSAALKTEGAGRVQSGNPDGAPESTQTREPPAK